MNTNIVMLVRDRLRLTMQSLSSLIGNTEPYTFNLTLVNDDSQDFRVTRLMEGIVAKQANTTMLTVHRSGHVLSRAKNLGVYWSEQTFGEGDFLYLSDNDVYFNPGWLDKLTQAALHTERDGYLLWGGQVHPFHQPDAPHCDRCLIDQYHVLDGPSWLMRWKTWRDHGPLSRLTAPGPCQSEEYPFCQSIINSGGHIGAFRTPVVLHTGLTQTGGARAPGWEARKAKAVAGVIYE